jgi:tetratricopeptide (TPR) repeat protein
VEEPAPSADNERAGEGNSDRAAAESLLKVGEGLVDLGQYDEAALKLQQSLDAWPLPDAAWLLAVAHDKRGRVASAWAAYRQAIRLLRQAGDPRQEEAKARADALEAKVPRLTIVATEVVPKLQIIRGDAVFGDGVLGVALALDPGKHRIEVRAPGYEPWSTEVELSASERETLTIPTLVPREDAAEPAAGLEHGTLWGVGLVTGGVGIVSVGIGALLGAIAAADVNRAESDELLCGLDRVCTAEGSELIERAERQAIASTVLMAVGGAAVVAGFVMVAVDVPGKSESVALVIGPGQVGLQGAF